MGAALQTVTVQHERAKRPRTVRISRNIKRAIDLMVLEGKKRPEAAEAVQITDDALRKALLKSDVLAYRNECLKVLRTSVSARSISAVEKLMDGAESEHVKMKAAEFAANLDPATAPVERSEATINHKGLGPGLVIEIAPPRQPLIEGRVIHSQLSEPRLVSREKHLKPSVPHPERGTASPEGENHGRSLAPVSRG